MEGLLRWINAAGLPAMRWRREIQEGLIAKQVTPDDARRRAYRCFGDSLDRWPKPLLRLIDPLSVQAMAKAGPQERNLRLRAYLHKQRHRRKSVTLREIERELGIKKSTAHELPAWTAYMRKRQASK